VIDLRTLEVFYWVARLGGFGRAADKLHTTQPAVSARIAALEAQFNTRLLDRDRGSRPALTARGAELLGYAERILALQAEAVAALTAAAELCGIVRLGTSETIVHTWLAALVRRLHAAYPRLTLDITVDVSGALREALRAGEIDVALLLGPLSLPEARNLPLCDYPLAWVASPELALPPGPLALTAISRWPILTYARNTRPYAQVAALFRRADLPPARISANSSLASIVRMALDGIGIAVIPPAVIGTELADGRLVPLDVAAGLDPLRFTATYLLPGDGLVEPVARLAQIVAAETP
jgi:DNA-binding transcriptional LysR family regulator